MKIQSDSYFKMMNDDFTRRYSAIRNIKNYMLNPPYIVVKNRARIKKLYVENMHLAEKPTQFIPYSIGVWKIKYKQL